MGRYNLNPARVHQRAAQFLELRRTDAHSNLAIAKKQPWFTTVGQIPPSEILTRPQPIQHQERAPLKKGAKKPSKMFMPMRITYEEDAMRNSFFQDHPWELARPRMILEQDGKDGQKCDWSKLQQPGRELNGESVVQRQLWLLKNVPGMTSSKAYDKARQEFYAIRHQEDIERRVAKEEALATGAYFGKSMLEVGMELEDKVYESWKEWATQEIEVIAQQRSSQYTGAELLETEEAKTTDAEPAAGAL